MIRSCKYIFRVVNSKRFYTQNTLKQKVIPIHELEIHLPKPQYNVEFFCNPLNRDLIAENIARKKSLANIDRVLELYINSQFEELIRELNKIPNLMHYKILKYPDNESSIIKIIEQLPIYDFKLKQFSQLATNLNLLSMKFLGQTSVSKPYAILGDLAELEQALIMFTLKELFKHNFQLISVPDILPSEVIERCGLIDDHERHLVYRLDPLFHGNFSLSGTAEMALAYKLSNKVFCCNQLPIKLAAVSRCYRAEISNLVAEQGIYRVHQFTKVEMFISCKQNQSTEIMKQIVSIQENLFSQLNLHFKILDMPPNELGTPAYRKIDIEAWMPGREMFGEISSCSDCTDYQSRRLNIRYKSKNDITLHTHTLNGTACAIPRMLIAICETNQLANGDIVIPKCLIPFMNGKRVVQNQKIPLNQFKILKKG